MSSIDLSKKMSGHEARQWITNIFNEINNVSPDAISQLIPDIDSLIISSKPVDYKAPRKPRSSKVSSDSSQRSSSEYNPSLCDARIWLKGGFDAQCSRKKPNGGCLCTRHSKEAAANNGELKNGYVWRDGQEAPRPTHHYGDDTKEFINWHDVDPVCKPVKRKVTTRKCSSCGQEGHTKRKCPLNMTTGPIVKDNDSSQDNDSPQDIIQDIVQEIVEEAVQEPDGYTPDSPRDPVPEDSQSVHENTSEDNQFESDGVTPLGAGTGLDLDDSTQHITFKYDNVPYVRDSDNNVYDPQDDDDDVIGTYNPENGSVKFTKTGAKAHKFNIAMLDNDE